MGKKQPKPYKPPTPKPPKRQPIAQNNWYCHKGCGFSSGNMQVVRNHEAGCNR